MVHGADRGRPVFVGGATDNDMGACDCCPTVVVWCFKAAIQPCINLAPPQYPTNLYPPGPLWERENIPANLSLA
jgi:hypothetical protein